MNSSTQFDGDAAQVLQEEMMQGESILWSGRPLRRIVFDNSDWIGIPFSLFWGGFSLFWMWGASGFGDRGVNLGRGTFPVFSLFGIPFVLAGQYFIWGRFLFDVWKKTHVVYGVTNRRVLVIVRGQSRRLIDKPLRGLDSLNLTVRADGAGTISFSEPLAAWGMQSRRGNGMNFGLQLESLNFYDIPDARGVYELIRDHRDQELRISL